MEFVPEYIYAIKGQAIVMYVVVWRHKGIDRLGTKLDWASGASA